MKVAFDTNVDLDVLLDRSPHSEIASQLFAYVARSEITGILSATSITTIHYVSSKNVGKSGADKLVESLIGTFEIAEVNDDVIRSALKLSFADFEDAVLHEVARNCGADAIVTRDPKGFAKGSIRAFQPQSLLVLLESGVINL